MKLSQLVNGKWIGTTRNAFTLVEILVSLTVCSFAFVSLFAGLTQSTQSLQRAREKLRGTQILTEKIEVLRLYNWEQLKTPGFVPTSFSDFQYPTSNTNGAGKGVTYYGTISITPVTTAEAHPAYTNTMRKVTATVRWYSNGVGYNSSMETLVSEFGVQRYVY